MILRHYWLPSPRLPGFVEKTLEEALCEAIAAGSVANLDALLLEALHHRGLKVKSQQAITGNRRFKDDIRLHTERGIVSIEIEKAGNRLEFDLLKMMAFAESLTSQHQAFGCLIIPATLQLKNPFISGSGKEEIWHYVTKRLLPMIDKVRGLKLANILVLGYANQEPNRSQAQRKVSLRGRVVEAWREAGSPRWDLSMTLKVAIDEDEKLERRSIEPSAQMFRIKRLRKDQKYMQNWVRGCKFQWLVRRGIPGT